METAQLRLERMLPELRDLEQKKLFTKGEVSAIVKQRTAHELAIARPKSEGPFLQYIDYERKLEKLRQIRHKKAGSRRGFTVSDWSIPRHIVSLYVLATRRFPTSSRLWRSYISYTLTLSSTSPRLISRALASAVVANPSGPEYWVSLIRWEAEGGKAGGDFESARRTAMRALRLVKGKASAEVWKEWVRVELLFMAEMGERMKKLGLGRTVPKGEAKAREDDPMEGVEMRDGEELERIDLHPVSGEVAKTTEATGLEALADGALVRTILSQAFESCNFVEIYEAVLPILRALPATVPARSDLLVQAYSSLRSRHPTSARARRIIATRHLFDDPPLAREGGPQVGLKGGALVDGVAKAVEELERACKEAHLGGAHEELVGFILEMRSTVDDEDLRAYLDAVLLKTLSSFLKRKTAVTTTSAPSFLRDAASALSTTVSPKLASLLELATDRYPTDGELWRGRLAHVVAAEPRSDEDVDALFAKARTAAPGAVGPAEAWIAWVSRGTEPDKVAALFEAALPNASRQPRSDREDGPPTTPDQPLDACEAYLRALVSVSTSSGTVDFYRRLANVVALPPHFLRWAITVTSDRSTLLHLHRALVSHPEADVDAWMEWLKFLLVVAQKPVNEVAVDFEKASAALSRIGGSGELETRWTSLLDGQSLQ